MIVARYMSKEEFYLFNTGVEICGKHHFNCRTDSQGICFLGEKTEFVSDILEEKVVFTPEQCYRFLSGIVSSDLLCFFETDVPLTQSWGVYADPFGCGFYEYVAVPEYCVPSYNRDTFTLLSYEWVDEWVPYFVNSPKKLTLCG